MIAICNISNGALGHWRTLELFLWWEINWNKRHKLYESYTTAHWDQDLIMNTTVPTTVDKTSECCKTGVPQTIHSLSEIIQKQTPRASKRLIENWGKTPSIAVAIIRAVQRKTGICLVHITAGLLIRCGSMKSKHQGAAVLKGNDTRERADRKK